MVPDDRGCQHKKLEAMLPTLAPFDVGLLLQMLSSMPVMLPFVSFQKLYFLQMLRILRFVGRGLNSINVTLLLPFEHVLFVK